MEKVKNTYILAGGSGFVGTQLATTLLSLGHAVYILSTKKKNANTPTNGTYIYWNTNTHSIEDTFTCNNCIIINLAGESVANGRWTNKRKEILYSSRINSIITLQKAIQKKQLQPTQIISASAIGYYSEQQEPHTETDTNDTSFLALLCATWEQKTIELLHTCCAIPVTIVRIGIVLGKQAGAYKEFLTPLKFGVVALPGNKKQCYSWIHLEDLCAMLVYISILKNNTNMVYNAVAPFPCSMQAIATSLSTYYKPSFFKLYIPTFVMKLLLGSMASELFKSIPVSSKKIQSQGFTFMYPTIDACIKNLAGK